MRQNNDCILAILKRLAAAAASDAVIPESLDGCVTGSVDHHIDLALDNGYITKTKPAIVGRRAKYRLTSAGHAQIAEAGKSQA